MAKTPLKQVQGFRAPWTNGAKAYHEADTPEALVEGARRKRKTFMVHLNLEGFGHMPCAGCGIALRDPYAVNEGEEATHTDKWGTGHYNPPTRRLAAYHYYCSWGSLMKRIFNLNL
jgi:hypothetical protein